VSRCTAQRRKNYKDRGSSLELIAGKQTKLRINSVGETSLKTLILLLFYSGILAD